MQSFSTVIRSGFGVLAKLSNGIRPTTDLSKMGADLSRGPNATNKLPAAAWSNTWPAPQATLDLDFANNRGYVRGVGQGGAMDAVTFTRAATGTYVDSTGTLQSAGNNVPRFDWASTDRLPIVNRNFTSQTSLRALGSGNTVTSVNSYLGFTGVQLNSTSAVQNSLSIAMPAISDTVMFWVLMTLPSGTQNIRFEYFSPQQGSGTYSIPRTNGAIINSSANFAFSGSATVIFEEYISGSGIYRVGIKGGGRNVSQTQTFSVGAATDSTGTIIYAGQIEFSSNASPYQQIGDIIPNITPLVANSTSNGLLIEESRTNRLLWCRDGLNGGTAVGTNLLTYSEQVNNSIWAKTNTTVSANTTATTDPLGGNTADKLIESTATGFHSTNNNTTIIQNAIYTASIYAKAAERTQIFFQILDNSFTNGASITVDLSAGTILTSGATGSGAYITSSIQNAGNGWYRISVSGSNNTNAIVRMNIGLLDGTGNSSYTGDGTSGVYLWGAQINPYPILTDYQITTAATFFNFWAKSNITVAKNQTGIDGVTNAATSITATANNGVLINSTLLASGSRTGSVYLKRITGTGNIQVTLDGSTYSTVDLSNGLWNRIVLSGTVTNPCVGVLIATNGDAVAMDYGQIEDGAAATTPILTTTATATRSADIASMSGQNFVGWYNQAKGTVVAKVNIRNSSGPVVDFNNGGSLQRIGLQLGNSGTTALFYTVSTNVFTPTHAITQTGFYTCAVSYGKLAFSEAGLTASTNSSALTPNISQLMLGQNTAGGYANNCLSRITYYANSTNQNGLQTLTGGTT